VPKKARIPVGCFPVVRFAQQGYDFERLIFMNCPQCGEVGCCHPEFLPPPISQSRPGIESGSGSTSADAAERKRIDSEIPGMPAAEAKDLNGSPASSDSSPAAGSEVRDGDAWRDELSERLNRYRARRKAPPPRYPSLSLRFENFESDPRANASRGSSLPPHSFETASNHALALDGLRQQPLSASESQVQSREVPRESAPPPIRQAIAPTPAHSRAERPSAKIIEFPRFAWGPPVPPPDQLAEPVSERPRILDVPEVEPPAPALGGITMEAVQQEEVEKKPGIDIPLESAPFRSRVVAALVDGIIISVASALFGFIFWKLAAVRPPQIQTLSLVVGIPCLFWAAYQYLLVVHGASTPGLRVAGLELTRFDGTLPSRSLRRWRVLAAWLSAVSVGLGYAWVFLDEDALCWHDRITHTYLAPRKRGAMDTAEHK
jgi:uncharacterized RDD family membrane protein YckC